MSKYIGMGSEQGKVIPAEKAFEYALERVKNGTDYEKQEFVEWFYSGDWYYEEEMKEEF
ncbi:MAG: hypothetical protein PHC64_10745 [Candidatus Gastranaerophilales bacterium]|nr:hypothetical protein [Candidatus Gastranaerophilales bacterium]